MILYFAGYATRRKSLDYFATICRNRLISFEYVNDLEMWIETLKRQGLTCRFMADSGAYTAWKHGWKLDTDVLLRNIDELKEINEREKVFTEFHLINADVIPGEFNRAPTDFEIKDAAVMSYKRWERFKQLGVDVLPVHHQGEEYDFIDYYLQSGAEYICLSPANDRSTRSKIHYLRGTFAHVKEVAPNTKIHGLGLTAPALLNKFPWTSVDSATCQMNASYGKIWIRTPTNDMKLISLTDRLLPRGGRMHFDLSVPAVQNFLNTMFEQRGVTREILEKSFTNRFIFNVISFLEFEAVLNGQPVPQYTMEDFDDNGKDNGECVGTVGAVEQAEAWSR